MWFSKIETKLAFSILMGNLLCLFNYSFEKIILYRFSELQIFNTFFSMLRYFCSIFPFFFYYSFRRNDSSIVHHYFRTNRKLFIAQIMIKLGNIWNKILFEFSTFFQFNTYKRNFYQILIK